MEKPAMPYLWCTYRDWSFRILEGLLDLDAVPLIVTTKDCRYNLQKFEKRGLEILRIDPKAGLNPQDPNFQRIQAWNPKVAFFYGWSWMVPETFLQQWVNVTLHPGKLPKDRGGSPLQNQIRNGSSYTYANILSLASELDAGPVYKRERISLEGDDINDVWARMVSSGCHLTRSFLQDLKENRAIAVAQEDTNPTFYKRVRKEEAAIKPKEQTALEVYNIIRSQCETDPSTYIETAYLCLEPNKRLVIERASLSRPSWADDQTPITKLDGDPFLLASQVNNQELLLQIECKDKRPIYLTRIYVSQL